MYILELEIASGMKIFEGLNNDFLCTKSESVTNVYEIEGNVPFPAPFGIVYQKFHVLLDATNS